MTDPGAKKLALGVLVSGSGTNLQSILDAAGSGKIPVTIKVVLSNRPKAKGLDRARAAGVPAVAISHRKFDGREPFEDALITTLREHGVQWVALAGFMRLLTPHFLRAFQDRVVNIHPALLPSFPGTHGPRQALDYGARWSGCTVHFVDEGTDTGPIIAQAVVPVLPDDDEAALGQRILAQEHRIYPWVLKLIAEGRVHRDGRRVRVEGGDPPQLGAINPPPPDDLWPPTRRT
jgi:phosphoribosylglycinamide formyltransferase 1